MTIIIAKRVEKVACAKSKGRKKSDLTRFAFLLALIKTALEAF